MRAAVLCSGPSLTVTWPRRDGEFDIVIGVNAAVEFTQCDWWSVGDWAPLGWYTVPPRVGVCSQDDCLRHLRDGAVRPKCELPPRRVAWSELPLVPTYSSIAALGLAALLGAKRVVYFGDDKDGISDFRGQDLENRARHDRWGKERAVLASVLPGIQRLGVDVQWAKP